MLQSMITLQNSLKHSSLLTGRGLNVNLYRHAREEVKLRAEMQTKLLSKEKKEKEEKLRLLAQKAREERAGILAEKEQAEEAGEEIDIPGGEDQDRVRERDEIRRERARMREREVKMSHSRQDQGKGSKQRYFQSYFIKIVLPIVIFLKKWHWVWRSQLFPKNPCMINVSLTKHLIYPLDSGMMKLTIYMINRYFKAVQRMQSIIPGALNKTQTRLHLVK